jgi:hypothetical protein
MMINQYGHCPACGSELSTEKLCGQMIVCDCGWTHSYKSALTEKKGVDRVVLTMVFMCTLFVASFIHAVNWDTHFFTIIPLKLKQFTGMAQTEDLQKIVEICSLRSKHDCVEDAYRQMYVLEPAKIDVLAELAHIQLMRSRMPQVADTLDAYFAKGGKSPDAAYDYARALAAVGRFDQSVKYFKYVLNSKPKVFQVSVARSYVQTLIQNKKLAQAKKAIEHYRQRSVSSAFFMDKEYKDLLQKLGAHRTVASAKSS